eukprot:g1678.t1
MEANHALSRAHVADMLNGEGEASEVIGPVAACADAGQADDALRGGGILADEPGLGKTLSMLCLTKLSCPPRAWLQGHAETDNIDTPGAHQHPAANMAESASVSGSNMRPNGVPTGKSGPDVGVVAPTLIVLPNETILEQWEDEMRRFLRPEHMECVGRYLCPAGQPRGDATANQWASVAAMLRRSVTLTTVAQLRREEHLHTAELYRVTRALSTRPTRARAAKAKAGAMTDTDKDIAAAIRTQSDDDGKGICLAPLLRVRWWRVVIDEVQEVEGAATLAAKCARALTARMRWGVSGTPITRGLADLRGLLLFLAPSESPLTSTKWWVHNVLEPLKAPRADGASSSRERAQHILARLARGIMWRTQFSTVARSMQLPAQISLEPRILPSSLLELLVYQPKHAAFMNRARRQLRGYRDDTTLLSTKELRSLLGGKGSPITALLKGANHAGLSGPSASAKVLTARNAGNHMLVQLFSRSREECTKRLADTASALTAVVCDTVAHVTLLQAALGLLLAGEKSGLSIDPLLTLRIASQLDMVCKTSCPDNAPLHNAVQNVRQSQRYTFLLCAFKVAAKARARLLSGAAQTAIDGMSCASRVRTSEANLPILPARALRCIVSFIASVAEDAFARCRSNLIFRSVQDCAQLVQELNHCSSGVDTRITSLESTMMHINPVRLASWEYGHWPRLEPRPHDDIAVDDTHTEEHIHRTIRNDARPRKLSRYKLQVHPQHFRDSIAALGREIEEVGQACQSEQGRGILGETRRQPSKRAKALCKVVEFVGNIRPQDKRTMIGASEHLLWRYVYGTVSNDLKHSEWMWTCASCSCSNHPSADRCANCFSTRHGPAMDAGLGAGSHVGTGVNVSDAASAAADAAETAGTGAHMDGAMASHETVIVVREEVPVSGLLSMSTLGKLLSELVVKLLVARFKFIRMLRSFCQAVAEDKLPDLQMEDLGTLPQSLRPQTVHERFAQMWDKEKEQAGTTGTRPRLLRTLFAVCGQRSLYLSWFTMSLLAFAQLAVIELTKISLQYVSKERELSSNEVIGIIVGTFGILIAAAVGSTYPRAVLYQAMVKIRNALVTAIYRKALRVSLEGRQGQSTGQIVTIMQADVTQVYMLMQQLPYVFIAPALIVVTFLMIYNEVGDALWALVIYMIAILPGQVAIFSHMAKLQKLIMALTENRVKVLNDVIAGIRAIKVAAWEKPFEATTNMKRDEELSVLRRLAYVYAVGMNMIFVASPQLMKLGAIVTFYQMHGSFRPSVIFPFIALAGIIREPFGQFAGVLSAWVNAKVSCKRIINFLLAPEIEANAEDTRTDRAADARAGETALHFEDASFAYPAERRDASSAKTGHEAAANTSNVAEDTQAIADAESTTPVIVADAAVGAKFEIGTDVVNTASAKAQPFSLKHLDLRVEPGSLVAIVGSVGSGKTTLLESALGEVHQISGKVTVRGSCALACQTPFVLNQTVRDNIIFGHAFDKQRYNAVLRACALEHDMNELPAGDETEIGERGISLSGGQKARVSLARAAYAQSDIAFLDDPLAAVDAHVGSTLFHKCICTFMSGTTRLLVTNQTQYLRNVDKIIVLEDGSIVHHGTFEELTEAGVSFGTEASEGVDGAKDAAEGVDAKLHTDSTTYVDKPKIQRSSSARSFDSSPVPKTEVNAPHLQRQKTLVLTALQTIWIYGGTFVMSAWTDEVIEQFQRQLTGEVAAPVDNKLWLLKYVGCNVGYVTFVLLSAALLAEARLLGAQNLFRRALAAVLCAPISFFDTTPIGRILNRFTSDVASIDGQLMIMLGWLALTMSFLFFNLVSIAISTNGVMLILLLPVTIIFVKIFEYVRCSTTAVKRISSTSLSPVYSVFTETLVGISTIRAYRQQARFIDQNADMLTLCSRPQIIEGYISVWLSVQLGLCGAAISSGCFLIILWWPEFVSPGFAGLALSFSTGLVQTAMHVVNLSAQLEVELNSVERLRHYITQLPREKYQPEKSPLTEWRCDRGTVKLKNVQLRYRDGPLVLKGVNADIASHEKVGIVGRTGSGKSTLLIALFRIEELVSGSILIDDVDISELPLQTLRSMLCMVPQDPVMFGESLRFNLDPFDAHSDDQIWAALRAVQMETYVQNTQGALMHNVEEGGSNFSVGQRQLLCF